MVKISAPDQKKNREGALYDGREVFIRNIDFRATEKDVRDAFEKFGSIERVHLPPHGFNTNSHKGFGFVTFATKVFALLASLARYRALTCTRSKQMPRWHSME